MKPRVSPKTAAKAQKKPQAKRLATVQSAVQLKSGKFKKQRTNENLQRENRDLRLARDEARDTLLAISSGQVDALIVQTKEGEKVFTLKNAEYAYRILVESMNEGAATILADGTIVYCNDKFAELLGKSVNWVCGGKIERFIGAGDKDLFSDLFSQAKSTPAKGEIFLVNNLGAMVDVHVSLRAFDFNGVQALSMVVTDLTVRKHNEALIVSENLTRSILEQAAEGIIVCNAEGVVTRANPEAQKLIGRDPVNLHFDEAFPLTSGGTKYSLSQTCLPGKETRSLSVSLQQKDQTVLDLSLSISYLENSNINLQQLRVVTLTDITPIKRMEKLRADKEAAEHANTLKTTFLANMSHEIRTPLGAIIGFANLMQEGGLNQAEQLKYLAIISRSGEALKVLIDDILDLSKVEAGGMVVETVDLCLKELMGDIVALFSDKTASKKIQLTVEYAKDVPVRISSDPSRLRQVLVNIIGNAVKFTNSGKVSVYISRDALSEDPLMLFRVRDTGMGLSEDQQKRIFAPFTQGDESTTRKFGGTGLGLVLSRRLAQALGGDVFLEWSKPGRGSIFCISIAFNESVIVPEKIDQAVKIIKPVILDQLDHLKILLVDDSYDNRLLLVTLLKRRGAHVELACNGREGVDRAMGEHFDVIIMDIQMPVLDGYGATQELRQRGYTKPIIALTAYAMKEEMDRCVAVGCDTHLSKPINFSLAVDTILDVVEKSNKKQRLGPVSL